MKKIKLSQLVAFFALAGIAIGIAGTGLLILFGNSTTSNQNIEYTQEDLQKLIEKSNLLESTGSTDTSTGKIETLTGETN